MPDKTEAEKDTARWDWMEKQAAIPTVWPRLCFLRDARQWVFQTGVNWIPPTSHWGDTPRQAIDAAMEAEALEGE